MDWLSGIAFGSAMPSAPPYRRVIQSALPSAPCHTALPASCPALSHTLPYTIPRLPQCPVHSPVLSPFCPAFRPVLQSNHSPRFASSCVLHCPLHCPHNFHSCNFQNSIITSFRYYFTLKLMPELSEGINLNSIAYYIIHGMTRKWCGEIYFNARCMQI